MSIGNPEVAVAFFFQINNRDFTFTNLKKYISKRISRYFYNINFQI